MEVTISAEAIIQAAAILTALGVIGGVAVWCIRFVDRQKKQDKEIAAMREEQCMICYGLAACLDGLCQLGANHDVTTAKEKMSKYLNQAAHKGDAA